MWLFDKDLRRVRHLEHNSRRIQFQVAEREGYFLLPVAITEVAQAKRGKPPVWATFPFHSFHRSFATSYYFFSISLPVVTSRR